jgi:hypothetical protein
MRNLHRCYEVVLQNTAKGGITAKDIAKEMDTHKTVVHHLLNTLKAMKKVQDQHGMWRIGPRGQTTEPQEKEIVIELPIPRKEWQRIVALEGAAKLFDKNDPNGPFKTSLRVLKETRTIRITGKNVDDLDLEKAASLIKEAYQSSSFSIRNLFRKLTRQASRSSET